MGRFKLIAKYLGIYLLFMYLCFCFYELGLANIFNSLEKLGGSGRVIFFIFGLVTAWVGNEVYKENKK